MSGRAPAPGDRDPEYGRLLERLVESGLVTAAVAASGRPGRIERWAAAGRTRLEAGRAVRPGDRFDLASLSKPFAATLALRLHRDRRLPLETRLAEVWGPRVTPRLAARPLESLLRHRSGLRPWTPLYRRFRSPRSVVRYLLSAEALAAPGECYGDLDFILWGLSVERVLGRPYSSLLREHVLEPLGLRGVGGSPGARASVVESALGNEREIELAARQGLRVAARRSEPPGVVQDGNARFLGGLATHAGLFASAPQVFELASAWLAPGPLLARRDVERALAGGRLFTLGWVRRTLRGSAGPALGKAAFGHVGFTGGSVWLDPGRDRIVVLLAHRTSVDTDLKPWRRRFHRLALS